MTSGTPKKAIKTPPITNVVLQIFLQDDLLFCPMIFVKAMPEEQSDRRIIDGDIIV